MSRIPNQQQHPPNPGGSGSGGPAGNSGQGGHGGGTGGIYHGEPHLHSPSGAGPSMYHHHQHPASGGGQYLDPRMYEQHASPYGYAGPPGESSRSNGGGGGGQYLHSHPYSSARDMHGDYPPPSPHIPRSSPSGAWSSLHPAASQHHSPIPPIQRLDSRGNIAVKLEDLVSHDRRSGSHPGKGPGGFTSVPLGSAPLDTPIPPTTKAAAGPGSKSGVTSGSGPARDAQSTAADPPAQAGPSEFIKKLYKMLEEESAQYGKGKPPGQPRAPNTPRGSVGWGRGGTSFVVWDMNDFTTKVLPQTFRHSNFSSFVRQLNKYGFSKIKHMDEGTGQIRENIWEFQHPNFQAGGKTDLEQIKRKAVATKKIDVEAETSPARVSSGMPIGDDGSRLMEMENRIRGLEDRLASALEDVRQASSREQGMMGLFREILGQLSAAERGAAASSAGTPASDIEPSPRMLQIWQMYEQLAGGIPPPIQPSYGYTGFPPPHLYPPYMNQHLGGGGIGAGAQPSPQTDGSRGSGSDPPSTSRSSAAAALGSRIASTGSGAGLMVVDEVEGDIRPQTAQPPQLPYQQPPNQQYPGQPVSHQQLHPAQQPAHMQAPQSNHIPSDQQTFLNQPQAVPEYAETPAWLTEGVTMPMPMYHRKSSDGMAIRLMMEALASQRNGGGFAQEGQDPLDPSPTSSTNNDLLQIQSQGQSQAPGLQTGPHGMSQHGGRGEQQFPSITRNPNPNLNAPIVQSSPFGTLLIPSESSVHPNAPKQTKSKGGKKQDKSAGNTGEIDPAPFSQKSTTDANGNTIRLRRSTTIKPHWSQTPRILVVEDDVVYRQLSSKFLEKFGCVVETVENAQEAIAKMNNTKYDLVLMDIFFGPSMDGRKATSLIRQFDMYTPIISMTSNAQPQDVDSYLQSGMNDILAKPFTKHGLFGILDKHLLHMKSLQLSAEVPRGVGVPPLSDQGVLEAVAMGAASVNGQLDWNDMEMRNPLAAMGWSDDTYQIVLAQYLQTGMMPDISQTDLFKPSNQGMITHDPSAQGHTGTQNGLHGLGQDAQHQHGILSGLSGGGGGGSIGTHMVFGDFNNRKRSVELADDGWSPAPASVVEIGMNEGVGMGQDGGGMQGTKQEKVGQAAKKVKR